MSSTADMSTTIPPPALAHGGVQVTVEPTASVVSDVHQQMAVNAALHAAVPNSDVPVALNSALGSVPVGSNPLQDHTDAASKAALEAAVEAAVEAGAMVPRPEPSVVDVATRPQDPSIPMSMMPKPDIVPDARGGKLRENDRGKDQEAEVFYRERKDAGIVCGIQTLRNHFRFGYNRARRLMKAFRLADGEAPPPESDRPKKQKKKAEDKGEDEKDADGKPKPKPTPEEEMARKAKQQQDAIKKDNDAEAFYMERKAKGTVCGIKTLRHEFGFGYNRARRLMLKFKGEDPQAPHKAQMLKHQLATQAKAAAAAAAAEAAAKGEVGPIGPDGQPLPMDAPDGAGVTPGGDGSSTTVVIPGAQGARVKQGKDASRSDADKLKRKRTECQCNGPKKHYNRNSRYCLFGKEQQQQQQPQNVAANPAVCAPVTATPMDTTGSTMPQPPQVVQSAQQLPLQAEVQVQPQVVPTPSDPAVDALADMQHTATVVGADHDPDTQEPEAKKLRAEQEV